MQLSALSIGTLHQNQLVDMSQVRSLALNSEILKRTVNVWSRRRGYMGKLLDSRMSVNWWLQNRKYFIFMMREFSSIFILIYVLTFSYQLLQATKGPKDYAAFLDFLRTPSILLVNLVVLAFALMHSVSWFMLTSKVIPIKIGKIHVPPKLAFFGNIVAWIAVSVTIYLVILSR